MRPTGEYDLSYFKASARFQLNDERIKRFEEILAKTNPRTVLDVGCGLGVLVRKLREKGIEALGIDSAKVLRELWDKNKDGEYFSVRDAGDTGFPDKSFDVVISTDFFEHLPEDKIIPVLNEMKRVGKRVVAVVAIEDKLSQIQALYHLTNKPLVWWEKKLEGAEVYVSY